MINVSVTQTVTVNPLDVIRALKQDTIRHIVIDNVDIIYERESNGELKPINWLPTDRVKQILDIHHGLNALETWYSHE